LINLQRRVHQTLRWQHGQGLRLDAQHWCQHWLTAAAPARWCPGNGNYFETTRSLQLLQHGVVDAWVCSGPDVPRHDDLLAIPFVTLPIWLVVKPGHPLVQRGERVTFADLADYPVLPLPDGAFPVFQGILQDLGLWSCPRRDARFKQAPCYGRVPLEEMMIAFETPLRMAAGEAEVWCPLPLQLPVAVSEVVMVRHQFAGDPHLLGLLHALAERAKALAIGHPGVQVHDPMVLGEVDVQG